MREIFKNLPNKTTPINAENLNKLANMDLTTTGSNKINTNGNPLTGNLIKGNSYQDHEPSPTNPSEVESVGVKNLFDKDNANILEDTYISSTAIGKTTGAKTLYIPCLPNTDYTISKVADKRFVVAETSVLPANSVAVNNRKENATGSELSITTSSTAKYLVVFYYISTASTFTEEEIRNSIMIEEGNISHSYVPYGNWLVEKITGKNLFDTSKIVDNDTTRTSTTYDNTSISVKALTSGTYRYVYAKLENLLVGETYTIHFDDYTETTTNNAQWAIAKTNGDYYNGSNEIKTLSFTKVKTFVAAETTAIVRFGWLTNSASANATLKINNIMLEKNSTTTSYEPYKENIVKQCLNKKNYFTGKLVASYLNSSNGIWYSGGNSTSHENYIELEQDKKYTIVADGNIQKICFYNDDKTFYKTLTITTNTYTFVAEKKYARFQLVDTAKKVNIYEGTDTTPYYELNKIGEVKDTYDYSTGIFTRRIGKVTLNGSESWENHWGGADGKYVYRTNINNLINTPDQTTKNIVKSNYFENYSQQEVMNLSAPNYGISPRANNSQILVRYDTKTTSNDLKTWLSSNNVEVYYVLETPETIQLDKHLVKTFEGENNISIESNVEPEIENTYYGEDSYKFADSKQTFELIEDNRNYIREVDSKILPNVYSSEEVVIGTWFDKPLYRKAVDCGTLPNSATTKNVVHNINNIDLITKLIGIAFPSDKSQSIPLPYSTTNAASCIGLSATKTNISITVGGDRSWFANSYIIIEYTKTTDTQISTPKTSGISTLSLDDDLPKSTMTTIDKTKTESAE